MYAAIRLSHHLALIDNPGIIRNKGANRKRVFRAERASEECQKEQRVANGYGSSSMHLYHGSPSLLTLQGGPMTLPSCNDEPPLPLYINGRDIDRKFPVKSFMSVPLTGHTLW
jgi:hypothetical protein